MYVILYISSRTSSLVGKSDNTQENKHESATCLHEGNEQDAMVENDGVVSREESPCIEKSL